MRPELSRDGKHFLLNLDSSTALLESKTRKAGPRAETVIRIETVISSLNVSDRLAKARAVKRARSKNR